jgi:hypothetical protein
VNSVNLGTVSGLASPALRLMPELLNTSAATAHMTNRIRNLQFWGLNAEGNFNSA